MPITGYAAPMTPPPASVIVRDLSAHAPKGARLLHGLSFSVGPGELVGVMGPSGSGKSTLFRVLAGDLSPATGHAQTTEPLAYLPQDDLLAPQLTAREALFYAARLRLPPATTDLEIARRAEQVLAQVGLADRAGLRVGDARHPTLSGGQRTRVHLAAQLIVDPAVLLLDEPTSGLAAGDAAEIVALLRALASGPRAVVFSLHQPSREVFGQLDKVLLLDAGRVAFFGSPAEAARFFEVPLDPAPILAALQPGSAARFAASRTPDPRALLPPAPRPRPGPWLQWRALLSRYLVTRARDRGQLALALAQAPFVGGLVALAFTDAGPDLRLRPLFVLAISAAFFGCLNAAREVVRERLRWRRDHADGVRPSAWLLSRFAPLCLLGALQSAALVAITQPVVGLDLAPATLLTLLTATAATTTAAGLLLSTLVRSAEGAMAGVPLLLMPQILLAGVLVDLNEGPALATVSALTPTRWAMEGLVEAERRGLPGAPPRTACRACPADRPVCVVHRCLPCDAPRAWRDLSPAARWAQRHQICGSFAPRAPLRALIPLGSLTLLCLLGCWLRLTRGP